MQARVYTDTETPTYYNNKAPFDSHIPLKQKMRLGVAVREGAATDPTFIPCPARRLRLVSALALNENECLMNWLHEP